LFQSLVYRVLSVELLNFPFPSSTFKVQLVCTFIHLHIFLIINRSPVVEMVWSPYTYGPYIEHQVYVNPNAPYYEVGPDMERWWMARQRHDVAVKDEEERQARMRLKWETNTWETGKMKTGPDGYWNNYIAPGYYRQAFLELRGMATPTRNPFRAGGMQVHAVPEAERAVDTNGQRFPWAYEYAE
jgi:hypothetical protein